MIETKELPDKKELGIVLQPKRNCPICLGRGTLLGRHPMATNVRFIHICPCVKAIINVVDADNYEFSLPQIKEFVVKATEVVHKRK